MRKSQWLLYSILLLHKCGPPAILEVINSSLPIEVILYATEIQPEMRHLVNEKRSGIQAFNAVEFLPLKSGDPFAVAYRIDS